MMIPEAERLHLSARWPVRVLMVNTFVIIVIDDFKSKIDHFEKCICV